ncbi:MAG: UvrD-helicase domain-containing protein [Planctomycetaceae bacterium]|jgi:ATP-dependent exoDNAse (exonuclease V) beta subunit|nr:UvrD-helicase domain-containing protein [Planctomycetaceae bacterium]
MSNIVIRASAGSGKTFRLSNQFLQIVFHGYPVDTILASTFSRKAAGEILDRILLRLADAVADPEKRRELAGFLELPDNLAEVLGKLARNLYRLRICTLDSFFNKIASTFALELGLPPGWSIMEDIDFARYLSEAVRNVLSESRQNEAVKLMNLLQKGEQNRNITQELLNLATTLLPIVRESTPQNWKHKNLLQQEIDDTELQQILKRLQAAELPKNKDKSEPKSFIQARNRIIRLAVNGDWKSILGETIVENVVAGEFRFDRKEFEGDLLYCIQNLAKQAEAVQMNKLVWQTDATRQLLDLVVSAYDEILLREHNFRFDEITERLGRNDFFPTLDLLAHRIDARTDHLLLDEFQDTSIPQWKIIRPFAKETSSKANSSFFCVGDVKQAIYAWRGGVAEIFDTIQNEIPNIIQESLNASFRSSPIIIETVNKLFETIASNDALISYREAVQVWNARFEQHETAKKNLPGYCVLETSPSNDNSDGHSKTDSSSTDKETDKETNKETNKEQEGDKNVQYTVDRIAELYRTRPEATIGVLVFRNEKIAPIIAGLKRLGIEASEEGGNPLTDSAAVQHILSAMILADHPGDTIARFHLANGPLAKFLRLTDYRNDFQAIQCSLRLRDELLNDGYGIVTERLAKQLAPACHPREFQRLEKLTELARQFQKTASGVRTDRFVKMVQTKKIESPILSPIQIMTVHKSKGLEFDIIVLPNLDSKLVAVTPQIIVARETPVLPVDLVIRYAGEELQSLLPKKFKQAFEKWIHSEIQESLSLLYVAMTRAKHELVMIVPPINQKSSTKSKKSESIFSLTFARILRAGLISQQEDSESKILFQMGNKDWSRELRELGLKKPETIPQPILKQDLLNCSLAKRSKRLWRNLLRVSPSSLELQQKPQSKFASPSSSSVITVTNTVVFSKRLPEDALLWGTAIHACFENGLRKNPWLDQGKPDADFLLQVVQSAIMGKKGNIDPHKAVNAFLESCNKPNIRNTLSLSNYVLKNRTVDVEHERRFVVRLDDEQLLRGSIDRLVIFRENGQPVGLEIIDYKTDHYNKTCDLAEFIAEHQKMYAPQLEAYRNGMSKLYRIDPSVISAKLLFIDIDYVQKIY